MTTAEATPAAGTVLDIPAARGGDFTLVASGDPPIITLEEAFAVLEQLGVVPTSANTADGMEPRYTATYGLATFSRQLPTGEWVGLINIPLGNGEVLEYIVDRPTWIIDFSNITWEADMSENWPDGVFMNHTVVVIDALSRMSWMAFGYVGD